MSRKGRIEQFRAGNHGYWMNFSPSLVTCAETLLGAALDERRGDGVRYATNHLATNAIGAAALIVNALDVWVVEYFDSLAMLGHANAREVATTEPPKGGGNVGRYASLGKFAGIEIPQIVLDNLGLAAEIRNEVEHHLTRPIPGPGSVPSWLHELERRELFLTFTPKPGASGTADLPYAQKLASYKLAYWAFRTVEAAVDVMVAFPNPNWRGWINGERFRRYRELACPPEELGRFDAEHDLKLTES